MYVYTYIIIHVYSMCVYIHICIDINIHAYIHTYMHACMHTYISPITATILDALAWKPSECSPAAPHAVEALDAKSDELLAKSRGPF